MFADTGFVGVVFRRWYVFLDHNVFLVSASA
jgi:hypothetical protein